MKKFIVATLFLLLISTHFLEAENILRIVNGEIADENEWTGVVVYDVFLDDHKKLYCSGVLIHSRVVLTAAHCLTDVLNVNIVTDNLNNKVKVLEIIKHEDYVIETTVEGYVLQIQNDIAVLITEKPIYNLKRYRLRDTVMEKVGEKGIVVGYGEPEPGIKKYGQMEISDINIISDKKFTAEKDPATTCSGDSGGPFFTILGSEYVLSGVTSTGDADCQKVGDFTHVPSYKDWIEEKMMEHLGHGLDDVCGNAVVENNEVCEAGTSIRCSLVNKEYSPDNFTTCSNDCDSWNESECHICGDRFVSGNEICEIGQTISCSEINTEFSKDAFAPCNKECSGWDESFCLSDEYSENDSAGCSILFL